LVLERAPIERPSDRSPVTFVCPACDVVLWDGVAYATCPVCDLPVDWVDVTIPIWCCPTCDLMVNEHREEWPRCTPCDTALVRIHALERPPVETAPPVKSDSRLRAVIDTLLGGIAVTVVLTALVAPLLSMALDPRLRYLALGLAAPVLLLPFMMAGIFFWALGSTFGELRDLARNKKTRVIHGLEHAAAKILEEQKTTVHGGLTHDGYFEIYVDKARSEAHQAAAVRRAANAAIRRVRAGERHLAFHRNCGTSMLVTAILVALIATASTLVGLFMTVSPRALLALGASYVVLLLLGARPLGLLAQRLLTVSTTFRSARILRIVRSHIARGEVERYDVYLFVRQ